MLGDLYLVGMYSDPARDPRGHTASAAFLAQLIAPADPVAGDDAAAAADADLDADGEFEAHAHPEFQAHGETGDGKELDVGGGFVALFLSTRFWIFGRSL